MRMSKEQHISGLPLFRECSRADLGWIAAVADEVELRGPTTLAREGATSREFVVVIDGSIVARDGGADVFLGRGSFFGELGILDGIPNTHTITARARTRLLVFESRAFRSLLHRVPAVAATLLHEMAEVMRAADQSELKLRAVA